LRFAFSGFRLAQYLDRLEVFLLEGVFELLLVELGHVGDAEAHLMAGDIDFHVLGVHPR